MMASSFTSIILMFILLLVRNSSAHTHQGEETKLFVKGSELEMDGSNLINANKKIYDVAAAAKTKNTRTVGRKVMLKRVLKEETLNGEETEISGKDMYVSKKHPGDSQQYLRDQNGSNMMKPVSANFRSQKAFAKRLVDDPDNKQPCFQHSNPASTTKGRLRCSSRSKEPVAHEFDGSYQNLESQKLLEAANEIVNLMNKDYPGGGGPRHKPPINNNEPLNRQHQSP